MHSVVLLDERKEAIRDAILWNDVRNTKQCKNIMKEFGSELLDITYNIPLEGFTLPKIVWIQENEPELWKKVNKILLPKDYLRYWLTNKLNIDYSDASGTLLMDLNKKRWSKEILDKFNISEDYLPQLVNSSEFISTLRVEIIEEYGSRKNVKVFAGGSDNACAALGAGIIDGKSNMVSIGTSGVVLKHENNLNNLYQGKLHVFHHVTNEGYYSMGVTLAAGHSLTWFKNIIAPELSYEEFMNDIVEINPGSEGLLYTPYLIGERTPHMDSTIRGAFIGIDNKHRRPHFTRAVVEGITYSLKEIQNIMKESPKFKSTNLVLVGGGAKSNEWQQINADIFNNEVKTLSSEEVPGLGAAMLATVGLGWFKSFEECVEIFVKYNNKILPNESNVDLYEEYFSVYQNIYTQTKELSEEISEIMI